jgi:hypothetical protein
MGKSIDNPQTSQSTALADEAARQSREIYNQTAGLRGATLADWNKILAGEFPTSSNLMFSGLRAPIEQQYNTAKQNILANTPRGGGLTKALADVDIARAGGLSDTLSNIWQNQLNQATGQAWGSPALSIQGLGQSAGTLGQLGASQLSTEYQAKTGSAPCCWNFLAAHGSIPEEVRQFRDEHYPKGGIIAKGYKLMSKFAVPLMGKYRWFKNFIDWTMARPIIKCMQWHYKKNRYGWVFIPFGYFWVGLWATLGTLNGNEIS